MEEDKRERYKALHVSSVLTDNDDFYCRGNGAGETFGGRVILLFGSSRKDGKPNSRTKKSERSEYVRQDAVEGLLALASISEVMAPHMWANNTGEIAAERLRYCHGLDSKLALEVAAFVERFGLLHMRSSGDGPDPWKSGISQDSVRLIKDFSRYHKERIERLEALLNGPDGDYFKEKLKKEFGYVHDSSNGDGAKAAEILRFDEMKPYAKLMTGIASCESDRAAIQREYKQLEEQRVKLYRRKLELSSSNRELYEQYEAEIHSIFEEESRLHLGGEDLENGMRRAWDCLAPEVAEGSTCIVPYLEIRDAGNVYNVSLLFRDALELFSAAKGDRQAFRRVLPKFHMEVFKVEPDSSSSAGPNPIVLDEISSRYTLWFESCGHDSDNPDVMIGDYSSCDYRFHDGYSDFDYLLTRQKGKWDEQEYYGDGWKVHMLCGAGETPSDFEKLVWKNLQYFLDALIAEGLSCNYKGRFAASADIDPKKPEITVNNFDCDLTRSLWLVLDLANRGKLSLSVARCRYCGHLIDTSKSKNNQREFCDGSCRSAHRKEEGAERSNKREERKLRKRFLAYMGSSEAVHVGMPEHMLNLLESSDERSAFARAAQWAKEKIS